MLSPVIKGVVDNYDSALVRSMGMTPRKAVAHLYAPPPDAPTPAPPAAAYLEHLNLPVSKVVSGILEEFLAADEAVGAAVAAVAVLASAGFRGRARGSGFESEEGLDVLKALERMPAALRGRLGCGEGGGEGEGGDDGDGDGDGNTDGDGNADGAQKSQSSQCRFHTVSVVSGNANPPRTLVDGVVAAGIESVRARVPVPVPTAMCCLGSEDGIPKLHARVGYKRFAYVDGSELQ